LAGKANTHSPTVINKAAQTLCVATRRMITQLGSCSRSTFHFINRLNRGPYVWGIMGVELNCLKDIPGMVVIEVETVGLCHN